MAHIGADLCGELPATCTTHGAQVQIYVNVRGSTCPRPVASSVFRMVPPFRG